MRKFTNMAFDYTTNNEWKQAFNVDFLYAFILATFLLFNGLAFSDYIYFNSQNAIGFYINLNEDSFNANYEICADKINSELYPEDILEITFNSELNDELNSDLIDEKELIKSELNSELITDLNNNKTLINSTLNAELNNSLNSELNNNELIKSNLINETYTLTTTAPTQETSSKNQHNVTTKSYVYSAPIVATPRPINVRNTTQHTITYTSHTNITTPQNKTFIKSEKNLSNASKIDLETLPEISFLLSDLIKTADLQGKNIILSFGAKWCLPCKQMKQNVYNNLEVNGAIHKDYLFQELDEKDLEAITLKNLYNVKVYPTTLIIDTNGNEINRYEEGLSKNRMINILAENTYRPTSDEVIVKVDASSQPIELEAAIEFLVSRAENNTLDFD